MPYPHSSWRLLRSDPTDGPTNMAVDEAILLANAEGEAGRTAEGKAPPTLRFFSWSPPCLSLGYAQPIAEVDRDRLARLGFDLVRRPTGGRAILHTDELTYSVVAPMTEPRVLGGVVESYQALSAGLMRGLVHLGLSARADKKFAGDEAGAPPGPVCFETPSNYEITVGLGDRPRKLLGSAQVRKRGVVLQHGTLPLAGDIARICDALVFENEAAREAARSRVLQRAATVAEALGRPVTWDEGAAALARGFSEALNLDLVEAPLTTRELELVDQLRTEKYAAETWNARL